MDDGFLNTYQRISGKSDLQSQDIYKIKRFLAYRSEMLFFYSFIDAFFKVGSNKRELWQIDFNRHSNAYLIDYFAYTIDDTLKNSKGFLHDYSTNKDAIKEDLEKIKNIFSKLCHALMHYDYTFFENLFEHQSLGLELDIALLDTLLEESKELYVDSKKNYLDDETIEILDEKELKLSTLFSFYSRIELNHPAFNKLINSMIMVDGIENPETKALFDSRSEQERAYYIDIHEYREYKDLYIEHKKLVHQKEATSNGQKQKEFNDKINEIKTQMNTLTKANSIARLEYKMRLAFGFITTHYSSFQHFRNNFSKEIKGNHYQSMTQQDIKTYLETSYDKSKKFFIKGDKKDNRGKVIKDREGNVVKIKIYHNYDIGSLKEIIGDNQSLKLIMLLFIFTPKELKGEFLGFIKKYYHDTKNISTDTKDNEEDLAEIDTSDAMRLKLLDRNITKLTVLNYALATPAKYNTKNQEFYDEGNKFSKIYKTLSISHNQEEFDKSLIVPIFRYYSHLYKLINDFEIYSLLKDNPTNQTLEAIITSKKYHEKWDNRKKEFVQADYYNFAYLIRTFSNNQEIRNLRNNISHLDFQKLIGGVEKKGLLKQRNDVIQFINRNRDFASTLGYNAINDFEMKVLQMCKRLEVNSDKSQAIKDVLAKGEAIEPNDYYILYKIKGVESINKMLLESIGVTQNEQKIIDKIHQGNALIGQS